MVLTCSPQQESTSLRFPSPSHLHHLDATSTLIQLRRSLSKSPSKSPAFRLVSGKTGQSHNAPLSPSPLSTHRNFSKLQIPTVSLPSRGARSSSPAATPLTAEFVTASRGSRSGLRKFSPLRQSQRASGALRLQSSKRVLGESSDSGNSAPAFNLYAGSDSENFANTMNPSESTVQAPKVNFRGFGQDVSSVPTSINTEPSHPPQPPQSPFSFRSDRHGIHLTDAPVKSSPLKRTDAPSRTDPSDETSPSAKRRSLHGTSDFNVFDQYVNSEAAKSTRASPEPVAANVDKLPTASPVTKRAGSLRKSTVHQRHERPALSRMRASNNLSHDLHVASSGSVGAGRKTTENVRSLRPTRRNLFADEQGGSGGAGNSIGNSSPGLNTASAIEPPLVPSRHPLSRTMTQSSSGDDVAQDSPTHVPMRAPPNKKPVSMFAKSLPVGFERPIASLADSSVTVPGQDVTATPDDYKTAKPLQAVFHTTGLISKRMKNLRDQDSPAAAMPDTPCKRPMPVNPMAPGATPAPPPRHTQLRRNFHAFGSPSTPFNPSTSRPTPVANGQGVGIFGSTMKPLNRRGSFLSVESDDNISDNAMSQSFELPATPSKPANSEVGSFLPAGSAIELRPEELETLPNDADTVAGSPKPMPHCKFLLSCPDQEDTSDADGDCKMDDSPSAQRRFATIGSMSFSANRRPSILQISPSNYARKAMTLPHIRTGNLQAKRSPLSPASPLFERVGQISPHTPRDAKETIAPPDPSGLSISVQNNQAIDFRQSYFAKSLGAGSMPPATPTANRESSRFQSHRLAQSSIQAIAEAQVDPSLTSRFDEVEMIGDGEFSSVFRVTRKAEHVEASTGLRNPSRYESFGTDSTSSSQTPRPLRVYAVKKSRTAYLGHKDRARKLKEVEVLSALGRSDHTIELLDHWEHEAHLYIQTEYCEEGSLDRFLSEVGRKARLDDFRIWKILLEIGKGLSHIHNCGYMHLDLKPANVLISFDGALKIADFGMASSWPAMPGIEAEGDREYIGPEILVGQVDKAADVFALGLIVFEIAGNVMLPDNGASWRRLREGDISDVQSLTSTSDSSVRRDDTGMPVDEVEPLLVRSHASKDLHSGGRRGLIERLLSPPPFMADQNHAQSLENMVKWMISPTPELRPTVDQLLQSDSVSWVDERRRAPATIYEGEWGPAASKFDMDEEMMDA